MEPGEDTLTIRDLRVISTIGVPEAERARPQALAVTLILTPQHLLVGTGDDLARTVDYFAVSERVRSLAATGERRLIETLAEDIGMMVLEEFGVRRLTIEVSKWVLVDCGPVTVRITMGEGGCRDAAGQ